MRGIISAGGYVPFRRLQRAEIAKTFGSGGGKGTRSVASYDEDTTTMGVEAARLALRGAPSGATPDALWFATASPAYLDKNNASTLHAALRLDTDVAAFDFGGALRSGIGVLRAALDGADSVLVVTSDLRGGLPTSGDESASGDGAGALLVGDDGNGPVIAEYLGAASATEEFLERWRTPGSTRSRVWEERFGEVKYGPLVEQAWNAALKAAELSADQVARVIVTGMHARAARAVSARLGTAKEALVDDRSATVGNTGSAHAALLLADTLESAQTGQVIGLVVLADGADVLLFRTTDAVASWRPSRSVDVQLAAGSDVSYGKFLAWRGTLPVEPPRRPEPQRISASAAGRKEDWKYAFVGGRNPETGEPQLPPLPESRDSVPMADLEGTIYTFTVDRIAYSPSPPIVFAVVDFDGGGRLPIELTDTKVEDLSSGDRVEMTFRRLYTADGIHNYFWKARPVLTGAKEA